MIDSGLEGKRAPTVLPPPYFAKCDRGYLGGVVFCPFAMSRVRKKKKNRDSM